MNGTLVKILARYVDAKQKDWDTYISAALHAYRTTVHASTKKTPFELTYIRKNRLSVDLKTFNDQTAVESPSRYLMNARKRLREAYSQVNEALDVERQHCKSTYDKKAGDVTFEEGDRVWLAAKLRKPGLSPKLQPNICVFNQQH